MVKQTKYIRLMGSTITVTESYVGEFESQRRFIEENKHLFKCPKNLKRNHPILKLLPNVMNAIRDAGGESLVFVVEKKLEKLDVNVYLNQLYIRKSNIMLHYLTGDEKRRIAMRGKGGGLDVMTIDPRGKDYSLRLKMCENLNMYVLVKEWGNLVRNNGLEKDDLVEIWCFRVGSRLRLAVNVGRRIRR